jgi:dTMP kinase
LTETRSPYEATLREHIGQLALSSSHNFDHINRVLSFALQLQALHGGDTDVITAAALLHDLGRSDPQYRGADSALQSAKLALTLLENAAFPREKISGVLQAIKEHDQPSLRPSTLEGRILKDADFLAGFGAIGIVRSAMWTGETKGNQEDLIDRLQRKMRERFASLEFKESYYYGIREYVFVRQFLDRLQSPARLIPLPPVPYIVIEGISGSGKSTQMEMLSRRYQDAGYEPVSIHEPTPWYKTARSTLATQQKDLFTQSLLLLLDRYLNVREVVQNALAQSNPVISDRSYLSSMVYQAGEDALSAPDIANLHMVLPQPTHIFLLDVEPEVALQRIEARARSMGIPFGEHEKLAQLTLHRERFLSLTNLFPHIRVINTQTNEPDAIHEQIWAELVQWDAQRE